METLVPLLVSVITVIGAVAAYIVQKSIDRRNALIEMRRKCYRDFLVAFIAMSDSPEAVEDIRRKLYQAELDLLVVGSDRVVRAVGALSRFYAETNADRFNRDAAHVRLLVAEICQAMRIDCFEKSSLSVAEVQALVPIA